MKKIKHKNLCKLSKKDVEANLKDITLLVINPQFICCKCARVANREDLLCHPQKLK